MTNKEETVPVEDVNDKSGREPKRVETVPAPIISTEPDVEVVREPTEVEELRETVKELSAKLNAVSDKGRLYTWEQQQKVQGKDQLKVTVARHDGKYVVGWRITEDEMIYDPRTGAVTGESQQVELILQDDEGKITKQPMTYGGFTKALWADRVEVSIMGRTIDNDGKSTFNIELPNGRKIQLGEQFVN